MFLEITYWEQYILYMVLSSIHNSFIECLTLHSCQALNNTIKLKLIYTVARLWPLQQDFNATKNTLWYGFNSPSPLFKQLLPAGVVKFPILKILQRIRPTAIGKCMELLLHFDVQDSRPNHDKLNNFDFGKPHNPSR